MSKKKGIIRLVVLLAVIAFVVYTAVSGLGSDRSGSLNDISLGLDLRGGVSITYEAVGDVNSQDMSDTKAKLEKRVQDYSTEAQVYFEGSDRITVDIPGATDANAYNFTGSITGSYDVGCKMQQKRIECAIMIKAALADMEEETGASADVAGEISHVC